MTFVVNKPWKFGHRSLPYTVLVRTTSRYFKFPLTYLFSFPFAVWKSNSWGSKCQRRRPGVTLTASSKVKQKKYSPQHGVSISAWHGNPSAVERMVLSGGSKHTYNSWHCSVLTFSSRPASIHLNVSKFMLILPEVIITIIYYNNNDLLTDPLVGSSL